MPATPMHKDNTPKIKELVRSVAYSDIRNCLLQVADMEEELDTILSKQDIHMDASQKNSGGSGGGTPPRERNPVCFDAVEHKASIREQLLFVAEFVSENVIPRVPIRIKRVDNDGVEREYNHPTMTLPAKDVPGERKVRHRMLLSDRRTLSTIAAWILRTDDGILADKYAPYDLYDVMSDAAHFVNIPPVFAKVRVEGAISEDRIEEIRDDARLDRPVTIANLRDRMLMISIDVPYETIRSWGRHDRMPVVGADHNGYPTYRLSDACTVYNAYLARKSKNQGS